MQSLKKIVTYGLMVLGLSFGLTVSTIAADDVSWVKAQAEQGNVIAQLKLASNYQLGKGGVREDYSKSLYWFKKAADQGSAEGQYILGYIYDQGKGVRQDFSKSLYWFKKAADQEFAPAQHSLGIMYELGQGVRQSKVQAKEFYGKSCDGGIQLGCNSYKRLNEQGH